MVKNPERWLKPTTSDQCGQNHGVYLWQSQVENEHYNSPSAISLERTALLSNNYIGVTKRQLEHTGRFYHLVTNTRLQSDRNDV